MLSRAKNARVDLYCSKVITEACCFLSRRINDNIRRYICRPTPQACSRHVIINYCIVAYLLTVADILPACY